MQKLSTAFLVGAGLLIGVWPAFSGTVAVYPSSPDWSFFATDANGYPCSTSLIATGCGSGSMVNGPATPPLGVGSANLQTAANNGDGAESLITPDYDGLLASTITQLMYSTYDTTNNGQQFPVLALMIDYTGGTPTPGYGNVDDIWFFEPPYQTISTSGNPSCSDQGATATGQWQQWNALTGCWWDNDSMGGATAGGGDGNVTTLAALIAAEPNATIVGDWNGNGGVQFFVGYASPTDNFNGNVDAFTIGVSGNNTTYDFEPASATPEPSTWGLSLIALGGLVLAARRRLPI